jgi:hypothetical protein
MRWRPATLAVGAWLVVGLLPAPCDALKFVNLEKVRAEAKEIEQMTAAKDADGLIKMLSSGEFSSKVAAAKWLGEFGDERALPELERLNAVSGGWTMVRRQVLSDGTHVLSFNFEEDHDGAFAVAICRMRTRDRSKEEQVDALLNLVEGKGPAAPNAGDLVGPAVNGVRRDYPQRLDLNSRVGESVAVALERFDDPRIVQRLRKSENQGVALLAVWSEIRSMDVNSAVARCVQIAIDEGGAQRYGAIHCLSRFGAGAFNALDRLARDGHAEAVKVLGEHGENPRAFDLLCWHLANNQNASVRAAAVFPVAFVKSPGLQVRSLQVLVGAFYDPDELVRRNAATDLSNRAYKPNKTYFDQVEDLLLIALKHPDANVSGPVRKALERLGCQRLDESVPDPPAIRTDLGTRRGEPPTAEQRRKASVKPEPQR